MFRVIAVALLFACTGVQQRFPDDVAAAIAHQPMRRLETDRFIIYYPAPRRAEVDRFLARADRCAQALRAKAVVHWGEVEDKMIVAMPDVPFNNAFVLPDLAGYEAKAVIPLSSTLDFATEFGLPPDPGFVACHELTHYVHDAQIAGFWAPVNYVFGHLYTPQAGYDPWFFEGLATHYEATLSPGVGRPVWPIFTGFFAAAYAGKHVNGGDLSSLGRLAPMGHHYLVGAMFVRFLTEKYGDRPLWLAIASEAHALTGWLFPGTFKFGFGVSFGQLLDQFDAWVHAKFPVRTRPASQHRLAVIGNDARYARGRDGTEAWVADDVDLPPRLIVRDGAGAQLASLSLVDVLAPRTLVQGDPLLVSGLSITGDGREIWLTVIDLGATYQVPRLLRWRRGDDRLHEVASELGPGATIDPSGRIYYYCAVDGDRWSLAAWDGHARRVLVDVPPGTYVLGAQISADGTQLAANVWDGGAFRVWVIDAASGQVLREIGGAGPVYDASFTSDGRVMWLGEVAERFQVFVEGVQATDAPYAVLAAREAGGTIRFLDRESWEWELAEVATPAGSIDVPAPSPSPSQTAISDDRPYCIWDHFWVPQERAPTLLLAGASPMLGLALGGGDRLETQRWSLAGFVQPGSRTHFGASAAYLNTMLAPVSILASASLIDWADPISGSTDLDQRRTRDASLTVARTWRGDFTASAAGIYTDNFDATAAMPRTHVAGPQLALDWTPTETTRYTGARRALLATATAAYYPHALSTFDGDITDVGGALGAVVPLPLGRRHTLSFDLRGRALVARHDTGLLQLGGDSGLGLLWNGSSSSSAPSFDDTRFPPSLRFVETLRGYEDYAITTDRAAIADVAWRYPVIVDRGVAATAWILPASYVRELDVEAFGAGALDAIGARHVAAGGAVSLRIQILRLPLVIVYQLARRLADDRALTQLVGVAPDL